MVFSRAGGGDDVVSQGLQGGANEDSLGLQGAGGKMVFSRVVLMSGA